MEEKVEITEVETEEAPLLMEEFSYLINSILEYYAQANPPKTDEEPWKKPRPNIPDKINRRVEKAFMVQLKKFHQ